MTILKKGKFEKLANVHQAHCVSIYLPTHRSGHEVIEDKDKVMLKNQLKEASEKLKAYGLDENEIKEYLSPIYKLQNDDSFWRHQSDGLALYLFGDKFEYMTLPVSFQEFVYVADHLYLKPLSAMLNEAERFFIMVLSLGDVKFFEGSSHSIVEVVMEGLIPQSLEEALTVGDDYEQKSLQYRSGQGEAGKAMFHGHGAGSGTEKKDETLKYFREINQGVMQMLHDEKVPLVLACVDYLAPIYKEANTYPYLFEDHISGNHSKTGMLTLHTSAIDLLGNYFDEDKKKQNEYYQNNVHKGLASYEEEKIIPAAISGLIDSLFIQRNKNLWGVYDAEKHSIKIDNEKKIDNACLLNKAAIETIRHGGKVYIMESDEMPEKNTLTNATFRYEV